jgi:hypothetical protein
VNVESKRPGVNVRAEREVWLSMSKNVSHCGLDRQFRKSVNALAAVADDIKV